MKTTIIDSTGQRVQRVFLAIVFRRRRGIDPGDRDSVRYVATWVAYGTGTELYRSSPKSTREEAIELAKRWAMRNGSGRTFEDANGRAV